MFRILIILFFLSSTVFASYIELKEGYVFLCDKRLRHILDEGHFGIQGEAGITPLPFMAAFFNVGFFAKEGNFPDFARRRVSVTTLSFGGKFIYPFSPCFKAYVGAAFRSFFYNEKNAGKNVPKERIFDLRFGPNVSFGLIYNPFCFLPLFINAFIDYSRAKIDRGSDVVRDRHIFIDPLLIGLGVGACF